MISSVKQDSWVDYLSRLFSIGGLSIPDYFIATILLWFLSVKVGWLPEIRYFVPGKIRRRISSFSCSRH